MRFCSKCFTCKDESQFYKCSTNKIGLETRCKACLSKKCKIYNSKGKAPSNVKYRGYLNGVLVDNSEKYKKEYYEKNRADLIKKNAKRILESYKTNSFFRFKHCIRSRINTFLKSNGISKSNSTQNIIGADFETVKKHIERQFKKGMNWGNHGRGAGKWQLDHIIPLASAKTIEDVYELSHYTNLQPLWATDNLKKGKKNTEHQIKMRI